MSTNIKVKEFRVPTSRFKREYNTWMKRMTPDNTTTIVIVTRKGAEIVAMVPYGFYEKYL